MSNNTKKKAQIVGYTSGVFDMFHIGHLNLLRQAKEQCDYLIVAVSTDELVQQYKNKLPIIPFNERCQIVEAIKYVDQVVPQIDRNKIGAFDKYHFDIMFVGDDWKGSPLFAEVDAYMQAKGGRVCYLKHTDGISSTMLRQKVGK